MENLCNLFFELSSEDRLRILKQLDTRAMNVTNLAKELDLTRQEVSRHASRLDDAGLIKKDSGGLYHPTLYGELILKQFEDLEFTSQHRNYFTLHTMRNLPQEFISRIGDLSKSRFVDDVSAAFYISEKVIKEAEKYVWSITGGIAPPNILSLLKEALERKVQIRNMVELSTRIILPQMREWLVSEEVQAMIPTFNRARMNGFLEEKVLEQVNVYLIMSEKTVAGLAFPSQEGRYEYSLMGFTSMDERAHKWCEDLYQYYWERATPRSEAVERLYRWIRDNPRLVNTLKTIGAGKKLTYGEKYTSELETKGLVRQGQLTMIGLLVYRRLQ